MPIFSWNRQRANFFTGLAVILPIVASVGVLVWLFGTVSNVTNLLLFFFPREWVYREGGTGSIYGIWSFAALVLSVALITVLGALTRYYVGKKFLRVLEEALLRIPVFNKIYAAVKQLNEAFSPSNRSSFRKVVMIEFPHSGSYSVGFLTAEQGPLGSPPDIAKRVGVFVPTTPNPTGGFLVYVEENKVIPLEMSVAEGLKHIVSLGVIQNKQ